MYRILILNLGSTSFKFKLYEMGEDENLLCYGNVENIGTGGSFFINAVQGNTECGKHACLGHDQAFDLCMKSLDKIGIPVEISELDAIGYKAVHGGSITGSQLVDEGLLKEMEKMIPFAPAHNPVYLAMMYSIREKYPQLRQIACFETSFHHTIPLERIVYGVPYEWVKEYGIRRYGFHGSSHSYVAWKMSEIAPNAKRVISIHLGGSCSLCALNEGESIATSMGATPQSGVFHNNRVGDFDVFCLPFLSERLGGPDKVMEALSNCGGLLGISGISNDLRTVQQAATQGNKRAELAIAAFVDAVTGYIGMYTAFLGGLDAVVFVGGIGFNAISIRNRIVDKLGFLNIKLDDSLNISGCEGRISTSESHVEIWSLDTNEELMVARGCLELLEAT